MQKRHEKELEHIVGVQEKPTEFKFHINYIQKTFH
jgi:hypothetical protein